MTSDEIRSELGDDVANIVEATSFDEDIDDYLERHYDIYRRCFELGRSAVLVKAVDILDNSDYYGVGDSEELQKNLLTKMESFVDESEPYIGDKDIYREFSDKLLAVEKQVS